MAFPNREKLKEILTDNELLEVFKEYCKRRLCYEHVAFYLDVEEYKTIDDEVVMKLRAQGLYDKYVVENAPLQLNIDASTTRGVEEALKSGQITPNLFDEAQNYVFSLMETSVLNGFLTTKEYQKLEESRVTKTAGIQIVEGWKHKSPDSALARKLQKEVAKIENEKEVGGIEHLKLVEENERLEKWCKMIERDQLDTKRKIQELEKRLEQVRSERDRLKQRQRDLRRHLEQSKVMLSNTVSLLNIIPEEPILV